LAKGPSDKVSIAKGLNANPGVVVDQIQSLLEAGLVMQKVEFRGIRKARAHVISLTPPGKQVAELLAKIDEIIEQSRKMARKTATT